MSLDARTAQEQLTPEQRRSMLRAFGDRMLLELTALADPDDTAGVERAVRTAAVIERIYSRCDRAERSIPDPNRLEAERARNATDAIEARSALASAISIQKINRKHRGDTWDAAAELITNGTPKPAPAPVKAAAETPAAAPAPSSLPGLPGLPAPSPAMSVFELADYAAMLEKVVASRLRLGTLDDTPAELKSGTAPQNPSPP